MKKFIIYQFPEALRDRYNGAGYAYAAVQGKCITDVAYISDFAYKHHIEDEETLYEQNHAITSDPDYRHVFDRLAEHGDICAGIMTMRQFIVLL